MDSSPESVAAAIPTTFSDMPDDMYPVVLRTLDVSSLKSFARTGSRHKQAVLDELLRRLDSRKYDKSLVSCLVLLLNNDPSACDHLNLLEQFRKVNEVPTAPPKLIIKLVLLAMRDEPSLVVKLLKQERLSGHIIGLMFSDYLLNQLSDRNRHFLSVQRNEDEDKDWFLEVLKKLAESNPDLFVSVLFQLTKSEDGINFLGRNRTLWVHDKILEYRLGESNQHILAWLARQQISGGHELVKEIIISRVVSEDVLSALFGDRVDWDDEKNTSLLLYLTRKRWGWELILRHWDDYIYGLIKKEAFIRVARDNEGAAIDSPASALMSCENHPFFADYGDLRLIKFLSAKDHGVIDWLGQLVNSELEAHHRILKAHDFHLAKMIMLDMGGSEEDRCRIAFNLASTGDGAQVLDRLNETCDGEWLSKEMFTETKDDQQLAQVLATTAGGISILSQKQIAEWLNFEKLRDSDKLSLVRQLVRFSNGISLLYLSKLRDLVDMDMLKAKSHDEYPQTVTIACVLSEKMVGLFWLLSFFAGKERLCDEDAFVVAKLIEKLSSKKHDDSERYSELLQHRKYFKCCHTELVISRIDRRHELYSNHKEGLIADLDLFISDFCDPADSKELYLYASEQPKVTARLFRTSRTTEYFQRKARAFNDTSVEVSPALAAMEHP